MLEQLHQIASSVLQVVSCLEAALMTVSLAPKSSKRNGNKAIQSECTIADETVTLKDAVALSTD
jgi:hypothetical protein